jgi:hypothetical protein
MVPAPHRGGLRRSQEHDEGLTNRTTKQDIQPAKLSFLTFLSFLTIVFHFLLTLYLISRPLPNMIVGHPAGARPTIFYSLYSSCFQATDKTSSYIYPALAASSCSSVQDSRLFLYVAKANQFMFPFNSSLK